MKSYDKYRNDKDFKLDSLSYMEIFSALRTDLEIAIANFEKTEVVKVDLILHRCSTRSRYGKDKNLYPYIMLEVEALFKNGKIVKDYSFGLNPFEVEMLVNVCGRIKLVRNEALTFALVCFMDNKFLNCDYKEKQKKYLKNSEIACKTEERLLFY